MPEEVSGSDQTGSHVASLSKSKAWATFKGWHTADDKLWREIYARTVATLLAAFIAYLIALAAGVASPAPLKVIGLFAALYVGLMLVTVTAFSVLYPQPTKRGPIERMVFVVLMGLATASLCAALFAALGEYQQSDILAVYLDSWILYALAAGILLGAIGQVRERSAFRKSQMLVGEPEN